MSTVCVEGVVRRCLAVTCFHLKSSVGGGAAAVDMGDRQRQASTQSLLLITRICLKTAAVSCSAKQGDILLEGGGS